MSAKHCARWVSMMGQLRATKGGLTIPFFMSLLSRNTGFEEAVEQLLQGSATEEGFSLNRRGGKVI